MKDFQPASDATGQAAIAELDARAGIETALADYAIGIDERDPDRWLSAFHEDAVLDVAFPQAVLKGHAEILAWAKGLFRFQSLAHLTGNHRITFIDDGRAEGICGGLGLFKLEDGTVTLASARLTDHYARRDGHWRIQHRTMRLTSCFQLNGAVDLIAQG